ncbi:RNA polymerase subunit sigma-24 (plasmid) [Methylobacterium sp. NMS14P]|uniref:sigma factor n=1 Tax=Methylobacterium sp. NMS14P TaxID=2894310 RepID=UPI00235A1E51|nr:sigma factor [Methylobacterium sp. NMS14P]WCS28411.1 RNA polymerase subunit sigma-24 [Methylobacterium sp. NMS14P]
MVLLYSSSGQCGIEHRMPYLPDIGSWTSTSEIAGSPCREVNDRPDVPPEANTSAAARQRRPHALDRDADADPDLVLDADHFLEGLLRSLPDLRQFAEAMAETAEQAESLVQETLLKAWLKQDRSCPNRNLRDWTFAIMRSSFCSSKREIVDKFDVVSFSDHRPRQNSEPQADESS